MERAEHGEPRPQPVPHTSPTPLQSPPPSPAPERSPDMASPTTVTSELELRLVVPGGAPLPVVAGLRYDPTDPYAVHVGFHTGPTPDSPEDEVVEWTFARQLLTDGVTRAVGEGDVQVWPSQAGGRPVVCLALSSPSGRALFEVPLTELVEFLTRTYAVVPTGMRERPRRPRRELALLLWAEPEL